MDLRIVLKLLLQNISEEIPLSSDLVYYLVHNKEKFEGCVCKGDICVECPAHLPYQTGDSQEATKVLWYLVDDLVDVLLKKN